MKKILLTSLVLYFGIVACKQLGLEKEEKDNTLQIATLAILNNSRTSSSPGTSSSCNASTSTGSTITNSSATLGSDDCVNGVTTCIDSAMPSWIKDNFKCVVAYQSGTNYIFKTKNLPNHKSYYYTTYNGMTASTTSPLYEALPAGNTRAGTNVIVSQNMTFTIPASPTAGSGTVSTPMGAAGITTNGLAIFNNAAAPGDVLASEVSTFDNYMGHPQQQGNYHHHAGVPKVCDNTTSTNNTVACNNRNKLIGIALDGFPVYSQRDANGNLPTLDSFQGTTSVTTEFPNGTYNYRYALNATATIYTLIGSFFRGTSGTITNN